MAVNKNEQLRGKLEVYLQTEWTLKCSFVLRKFKIIYHETVTVLFFSWLELIFLFNLNVNNILVCSVCVSVLKKGDFKNHI